MSSRLLFCIYYFIFSKSNKSVYGIAGESILGKSFRLKDSGSISPLSFHKEFIKSLIKLFKAKQGNKVIKVSDSKKAIYDVYRSDENLRKSYIKFFGNVDVINFIPREELGKPLYYFPKRESFFGLLFLYLGTLPIFVFSRFKMPLLLIFQEYLEMKAVTKYIENNGIKHLYHFNIYEIESNFLSYFLNSQFGVKTTKCPSEVPLSFWNKNIICNELIVCNGYQLDEIKKYESSIKVNEILKWGPEQGHLVEQLYRNRNRNDNSKMVLGYISTGAWIREKEGHIDQGFQMAKNELLVLKFFNRFLSKRNSKLIVYLHPREKMDKYYQEAVAKYDSLLINIDYEFAPLEVPSSQLFMNSDLVVSFYSSLLFERLYFGFKTIFYTLYSDDFPLKESSINNICAFSEEELESLINASLSLTDNEFFEKMNIKNYPYLKKQA
jgi:hypothetical protein|tara:strand:- start:800 stop:2113 length:1314 start_codon:yes stop_codon:yes gene_type:complete